MRPIKLAQRYFGNIALGYDNDRNQHPKWIRETDEIIRLLLELQGKDAKILDAPCGTGRLIDILAAHDISFTAYTGFDISSDMLEIAQEKISSAIENKMVLVQGDLINDGPPGKEGSANAIFCLRFVNWVHPTNVQKLLARLKGIKPEYICMTCRSVRNDQGFMRQIWHRVLATMSYATVKREQHLHSVQSLLHMLGDGWSISRQTSIEKRIDGTELSLLVFESNQ